MRSFYLLIVGLCFYASSWCQDAAPDENEMKIYKILENKKDVDFEFYLSGGQTRSFKYFLSNDTLWFAGTNLYTTVIPLGNIDFDREIYFLTSSLWKTKTDDKCIEVPLYAIKGKLYAKEEAFITTDEGPTDFAKLILPDKAFAVAFIKYLRERRP